MQRGHYEGARDPALSQGPLELALDLCRRHRGPGGLCRECFMQAVEDLLVEENPELCRGDAFELVQEWVRAVDGAVN